MSREKIYNNEYYERTPDDLDKLDDRGKKVIDIFSRYKFDRILDIGCGDGNFTMLIAKACNAREVYGIDNSSAVSTTTSPRFIRSFISGMLLAYLREELN